MNLSHLVKYVVIIRSFGRFRMSHIRSKLSSCTPRSDSIISLNSLLDLCLKASVRVFLKVRKCEASFFLEKDATVTVPLTVHKCFVFKKKSGEYMECHRSCF